jgi:2,3-bisphosphoglycerate-dependent phosphoglycerate mutase
VTRVWLIRHGESESNAGLSSSVPGSSPLTVLGRQQAERIALAFPDDPALIVTSPFIRARQTAQPTISRFPRAECQEWPVQEFTYLGELHGRTMTPEEREPHVQAYWKRSDPDDARGGGESFAGLLRRVTDCLSRLAAPRPGPVAVFTHGYFMRAVVWSLLAGVSIPDGPQMRNFRSFAQTYLIPNGSVVELRTNCCGRPVLLGGSTFHLPAALAEHPY